MSPARVLLGYATSEGHTSDVAARVAEVLREAGNSVDVVQFGSGEPCDPAWYDGVVLGGSIHLGAYDKDLVAFVHENRDALDARPSALFTVCMTAASRVPGEAEQAHAYAQGLADQTGWLPDLVGLFAGAVLYTRYGFAKRAMLKQIAKAAQLDTDTSRDWDYTDWDAVDDFAKDFSAVIAAAT